MNKLFTLLFSCFSIGQIIGQNASDCFWSDKTHYVSFLRDPSTCYSVLYDDVENMPNARPSEQRSTIVSDGESVNFYPIVSLENDQFWIWNVKKIDSLGDTITENFVTNTLDYEFIKYSAPDELLYETYIVELYIGKLDSDLTIFKDSHEVHVIGAKKGESSLYEYNFDSGNINSPVLDEDGHQKITKYPDYSANGNNRSDLGAIQQKLYDKCLYNAYYSNLGVGSDESESRLGDGCVHIFNPPKADNTVINRSLFDQINCQDFSTIESYDFLMDPCNVDAISDLAETTPYYKHTVTAKSQINLYPNHNVNDIFYYAFSSKIPTNFNEERLTLPNGAIGTDRWHTIAEFHQATWPYSTDVYPHTCQPALQLLYLGDDKIGVHFGLKDYNRCAFGPWEIEKGEWFDIIIHVKWAQVKRKELSEWSPDEGCLEVWVNTGEGYEKKCMVPATNFWRDYRTLGSKSKNIAPFDKSADHKTVFGPNLENFNPPYISLKSMRGAASGGTQGFDFRSDVFFDELRIAPTLAEVALPSVAFIPDSLLNCDTILNQAIKSFQSDSDQFGGFDWSVNAFPNPVSSDQINLDFSGLNFEEELVILLTDLNGKLVYEKKINLMGVQFHIDVSKVESGIYSLQVFSSDRNELKIENIIIE